MKDSQSESLAVGSEENEKLKLYKYQELKNF